MLTLLRMAFLGAAQGWEGQKGKNTYLPNTCHISYNDETWHSYTLPKEEPKNI